MPGNHLKELRDLFESDTSPALWLSAVQVGIGIPIHIEVKVETEQSEVLP